MQQFEDIPTQMYAVITTGNGGYDKLDYRLVATPVPAAGEVLVRVEGGVSRKPVPRWQ